MKSTINFIFLAFSIFSGVVIADDVQLVQLVGVWQYPTKTAWIKINEQGKTFQCRIGPGTQMYKSSGKIIDNKTIQWESIWQEDKITLGEPDALTLEGGHGAFTFIKINGDLAKECDSPI